MKTIIQKAANIKLKTLLPPILMVLLMLIAVALTPKAYAAPFPVVAHGGGEVQGNTYTNSLEALDHNYKAGHRVFELDLQWTSDEELVLIHDWKQSYKKLFNKTPGAPTLKEFKALKMTDGLTQLTLDGLIHWLKAHPDARVVTDVKKDNLKALRIIKARYPQLSGRFIPQIYAFSQYQNASDIGFKNIILTLYRSSYTDKTTLRFAKEYKLYAVTMPETRATSALAKMLKDAGVFVYAHTINNNVMKDALLANGISGIYSDLITPAGFAEKATIQGECELSPKAGSSIVIGYRDAIKRSFAPIITGRVNINGCGVLAGARLSYEGYDSGGKPTELSNKKFLLYKDSGGVFATYEIPLQRHILRSLPSGNVRIDFDLSGKDDRSFRYKYPGHFKTTGLNIRLSTAARILLKLRLLSKGIVTIALFLIPLLLFIRVVTSPPKDTQKNRPDGLSVAIPIIFAVSLEFYWGIAVNGFPLRASILSSLLLILGYSILFRFIKKTKPFLITAALSMMGVLLYFVSFDIYYSFFTDYPSVAMLQHSGQTASVLDSIAALTNEDHMTSLALALIYVLILFWSAKREKNKKIRDRQIPVAD